MTPANRLGLWTIFCAVLVGCAGDYLLRGVPWGLNVPLLTTLLIVFVLVPSLTGWTRRRRSVYVALIAALVFSFGLLWRASPVLGVLDVICALLCLSLALRPGDVFVPGSLTSQTLAHLRTGMYAVGGPVPIAAYEIGWDEVASQGWRSPVFAVARGIFIATPLVLVFGVLLVAADAVFEDFVVGIFAFDVTLVFSHVLIAATLMWISCGFLYALLFEKDWPDAIRISADRPRWISLGAVESGIVLGSLNVLFIAFVVVQAGYLFGGAGDAAMDFSEYARRGFFELVAVAALVIPLILLLDWLYGNGSGERRRGRRMLDAMILSTTILVGVILASALWRMSLYYREFGLTELRLYTTAFMVWIGALLLLLAISVPLRKRSAFGSAGFFSALLIVLVLNMINPDAIIAGVNLDRREEGKRFDGEYLTHLSQDAAPVILPALEDIGDETVYESDFANGEERTITIEDLLRDRWETPRDDWRSWNIARSQTQNLLDADSLP